MYIPQWRTTDLALLNPRPTSSISFTQRIYSITSTPRHS